MSRKKEKMDRAAILHIPLSQYAYATTEHSITIRLRTKKNDLTKCTLYTADRVCRSVPIRFEGTIMSLCAQDEFFDYYEAKPMLPYNRICYYFKLEKEEEWVYYYADRFTTVLSDRIVNGRIVDGRSEYYQYPFILRNEILDVPEWFKSAAVYNIFPDSFANEKRKLRLQPKEKKLDNGITVRSRLGGTLKGIKDNLDYICKMGFDCIYLNPVFTAGEYHKYDVMDYYHIDPCLGTEEDFIELVNDAHRKKMRVVIDGVFNHCSWRFFAFEDVVEHGVNSRYTDWFYDLKYPIIRPEEPEEIPQYTCFAYERKMPKLNTSNREVQLYFADVGAYWIEKYHVDGWRLDVANEISREFWNIFRNSVKKANPEAILIGEVWENAQNWLGGKSFDSTMNYEFRRICTEYLAAEKPDGRKAAWEFDKMLLRYPENIVRGQLNLLDSHDVPRFLSMCHGDIRLWKIGCILLILMPGVPSLFYGDECGIEGISEVEYRQPMLWGKNSKLSEFVQILIRIRKDYLDNKTGYQPIREMCREGVFAFVRNGRKYNIKVIVNAGEDPVSPDKEYRTGEVLMTSSDRVNVNAEVEAKGYRILLHLN